MPLGEGTNEEEDEEEAGVAEDEDDAEEGEEGEKEGEAAAPALFHSKAELCLTARPPERSTPPAPA